MIIVCFFFSLLSQILEFCVCDTEWDSFSGGGTVDMDGRRVITCAQDKTIINRIMLRFRPIAPRPAADGSSSSGDWKSSLVSSVRTKRKYVRVKKKNEYNKPKGKKDKSPPSIDLEKEDDKTGEKLFTLQLLPEKTLDLVMDPSRSCGSKAFADPPALPKDNLQATTDPTTAPLNLNLSSKKVKDDISCVGFTDRSVFETVVTVENVTDTCMDELVGGGCTDVQRMESLQKDTCPALISDGSSRVQWVNDAYRKRVMVRVDEGRDMTVRLVIKDKIIPYLNCPAFTCWVRLQYTWQKEKYSQIVPCDVWKMRFGGFAWRLDVKAALSLGL